MPMSEAGYDYRNALRGFRDVVSASMGTIAPRNEIERRDAHAEACQAWNHWIHDVLIEWLLDPEQLADDDVDPPSKSTIAKAVKLAVRLRDAGVRSPNRVVCDPNGNVALEFDDIGPGSLTTLRVRPDSAIQFLYFEDCRLVRTETITDLD